jgi:AcrR family transcriptional regulator
MSAEDLQPKLSRRGQAICHAADLLREGGPDALTSVAVAARMGITQSAVYRHVRDMEELSALAAELVVSELVGAMNEIVLDPTVDWEEIEAVGRLCRDLIELMAANTNFSIVDQWRFVDGALGAGIRGMIDEVCEMIGALLELRWQVEFGGDVRLSSKQRTTIAAHARASLDDGHAVARLLRSPSCPFTHDELADTLRYRLIAGWSAFVIDMNDLAGLPFPEIDLTEGMAVDAARMATSVSC